jgi:hypothetical protein
VKRWAIIRGGETVATILYPALPTSSAAIGIDIAGATIVEVARAPDPRFESVDPATGNIVTDTDAAASVFGNAVDAIFETRMGLIAVPEMKQRMHRRKEAEARALLIAPEADSPMLTAEAAQTGQTVADLADTVIAKVDAAIAVDADREAARRGAKLAVREAADPAAMQIIASDFRNEVSLWT